MMACGDLRRRFFIVLFADKTGLLMPMQQHHGRMKRSGALTA